MNASSKICCSLLALLVLALTGAAPAQVRAAEVRASLSTREAYVGAPITLEVEIANAENAAEPTLPDIAGLEIRSFGSPRRSSQTTIVNGRRTDRTSVVYLWRVIPRREGSFEIPALAMEVDGRTQSTAPLRFVASKSETGDKLFVEVSGQQQKIYVGQPLPLTLNLWIKPYRDAEHHLTLSEGDMWQMISDATDWGVFGDRLTELANHKQRPGGEEVLRKDAAGVERSYYHYQIEATIYPKRPGQVDLGGLQLVVDYPTRLAAARDPFGSMFDDDFFSSGFPFGDRDFSPFRRNTLSVAASRPIVASATVAPIEVTPIPTAGRPADYRGAVGRYQIVAHATPTSVKAGDPITLHLGVSGDGPMELVAAPPLAELPQLTADFQVAKEPLAGIVQGEAKLFTTSIRPRREGVAQIPAIPLSFFDPTTEKFVTVHSEPIEIQVAKADRLALGSIIGGGPSSAKPDEHAAPSLDFTLNRGTDALQSTRPTRLWAWLAVFAIPPLAVVGVGLAMRRQQWLGMFRGSSQQRLREAKKAIANASSPAAVAAAVVDFAAPLRDSALSPRLEAFRLECEQAAYAGGADAQQLASLQASGTMLLEELSTIRPSTESNAPGRRWKWRTLLAVGCLALAVLAAGAPGVMWLQNSLQGFGSTPAAPLSTEESFALPELSSAQKKTLLAEADAAYEEGTAALATDAAAVKEAFSTAAAKYQLVVDSGVQNGDLYCNLANAYLQSGSLGRGIANYEQALRIDPSHSQARRNLKTARQAIVVSRGEDTQAASSFPGVLADFSRWIHPRIYGRILALGWFALGALAIGQMLRPHRGWRCAMVPAAAVLLVGLSMAASNYFGSQSPQGVVVAKAAVLHQFPFEESPSVAATPLPEGESVAVLSTRGQWLQVQTQTGVSGWVAAPEMAIPTGPSLLQ